MSMADKCLSMSEPLSPGEHENDDYAVVERAAELIWQRTAQSLTNDECYRISDRAVMMLFTAAVKLYARKCDGEQRTFRPLAGAYDEVVTPTEALTATTELLWARRQPEDYRDLPHPDADKLPDQERRS